MDSHSLGTFATPASVRCQSALALPSGSYVRRRDDAILRHDPPQQRLLVRQGLDQASQVVACSHP